MLRALNELPQKSKPAEPGADWAVEAFFVSAALAHVNRAALGEAFFGHRFMSSLHRAINLIVALTLVALGGSEPSRPPSTDDGTVGRQAAGGFRVAELLDFEHVWAAGVLAPPRRGGERVLPRRALPASHRRCSFVTAARVRRLSAESSCDRRHRRCCHRPPALYRNRSIERWRRQTVLL